MAGVAIRSASLSTAVYTNQLLNKSVPVSKHTK